jgi:hypothetical protein
MTPAMNVSRRLLYALCLLYSRSPLESPVQKQSKHPKTSSPTALGSTYGEARIMNMNLIIAPDLGKEATFDGERLTTLLTTASYNKFAYRSFHGY